ncbi:tetratricopeptide repeat protein [Streptomyces sp. C10-9-1]|uniref:tetratricopeptide repeat protein n=1 Tax=Streptomyces sp. C10-9-1 TaxID=1859285 RepID=UPI003D7072F6
MNDGPEPTLIGRPTGEGRVYQAVRDQYISEHHHHYPADSPLIPRGLAEAGTPTAYRADGPMGMPAPASVRVPLIGRAPSVLRDRRELVGDLLRAAEYEPGGVHVLHGLGGCGKTRVAYEVFNALIRGPGRVGLWVNASDVGTVRAGMMAVAADRGADTVELAAAFGGRRAAADLVWHYLDHSAEPWILVLDNADDPPALGDGTWLRASPRGTVLVTSRQPHSPVWADATRHRVDVLPTADAAQILCDLAPHAGTAEEAEAVARRLDCLPLALTLAGAFLSNQVLESWSMDEYRRRLDDDVTELLDRGRVPGLADRNARQLVSRTWELSLSALADAGVPESATLLRLLSQWSADPVPVLLIQSGAVDAVDLTALDPPLPGARVEAALRGLLNHSLVDLVDVSDGAGTERCVKAHGLLLEAVAASVPDEQKGVLARTAAQLLERGLPAAAQAPMAPQRLAPHTVSLLRTVKEEGEALPVIALAVRLARLVFDGGDFATASFVAHAAAAKAERVLGPGHRLTLGAHHLCGLALFRLGRFEESEAVHRRVLEARERALGPEAPETLESHQGISEPLSQLGRTAEAVAALRTADAGYTGLHGPEHPAALHARALVIEYLALLQDAEEFDRVGPATVTDCERVLGEDALTTVTGVHNYAYGLFRLGRFEEAEPFARRALTDRERVHGTEHPLTLSASVLLGWVLEKLGRKAESIEFAQRALRGQESALGEAHPYVLETRIRLAGTLASIGRSVEAGALARRNLPLCERVLGADDALTAETRELVDRTVGPEETTSPLGRDGGPVERA